MSESKSVRQCPVSGAAKRGYSPAIGLSKTP